MVIYTSVSFLKRLEERGKEVGLYINEHVLTGQLSVIKNTQTGYKFQEVEPFA